MAKTKKQKKETDKQIFDTLPAGTTWHEVARVLSGRMDLFCSVSRNANGSTVIDFADSFIEPISADSVPQQEPEVQLVEVEVEVKRNLWERIKYVFTG